jgi:hypothetical protein
LHINVAAARTVLTKALHHIFNAIMAHDVGQRQMSPNIDLACMRDQKACVHVI